MKNRKIEIKWAIIFFIAGLLWMTIEKLAGLHDENIAKHATYTMLFAIPAVAIYIIALLEKRNKFYGGNMTYKEGFKSGMVIALIIAVLSPISQYITSTIISKNYFANAITYSVASGKKTQESAEQFFNLQSYIVQGIMGALILGLLTTAIITFFIIRKKTA